MPKINEIRPRSPKASGKTNIRLSESSYSMFHFADLSISFEPAFPALSAAVAGVLAVALIALTIWTYLGVASVSWRRVSVVLLLRLLALSLVFAMMFRPSFAMTQLDGLEPSKLLVLWDVSASMNLRDVEGKPSRWQHAQKMWADAEVQQRLRSLKDVNQIDIVQYLAADALKTDDPSAEPTGKRTDIGAWLHELWQKHSHEKRLRGIVVLSDGADNGTKFSAIEKARPWRGIVPIFALGLGDAKAAQRKDIAIAGVHAEPSLVPAKGKLVVKAIVQAPGFKDARVRVSASLEDLTTKKIYPLAETAKFEISRERDLDIVLSGVAPEIPGEYKLTVTIEPQPGEAKADNNSVSTYVQVIQEKINILWIDRTRVYEPTLAIRTLAGEKRFDVFHFTPPIKPKKKLDPHTFYQFNLRHYNLIVIGDISADRAAVGDPGIFDTISKMVVEKKTGLLMLGGGEAFANGGWDKIEAIARILPIGLETKSPTFVEKTVRATIVPEDLGPYPFLRLVPDSKENDAIWRIHFDKLEGYSPVGPLAPTGTLLLKGDGGQPLLAVGRSGLGRVAALTVDSTASVWLGSPEAARGYHRFWQQFAYWLAQQEDDPNQLWIRLDKRRLLLDEDEQVGFTFGLRGKSGNTIKQADFKASIVGPAEKVAPVTFSREDDHQRGKFERFTEPGEYRLRIEGTGKDTDGKAIDATSSARFLVVAENLETMYPAPDHELLARLASASGGQFQLARVENLTAYLDRIAQQATAEARVRTVHWPDWRRLPNSSSTRDQISGAWSSFSFGVLALFVALLTSEWLLRKRWGMV